jgi:hypothetical protein
MTDVRNGDIKLEPFTNQTSLHATTVLLKSGPSGRAVYGVVYGRSPSEILGSNPTGGMDVFLL